MKRSIQQLKFVDVDTKESEMEVAQNEPSTGGEQYKLIVKVPTSNRYDPINDDSFTESKDL